MRASFAVLAFAALTAGCGSTPDHLERGAPSPGSLEFLWRHSGQSVLLILGTSDYSPGTVRISFLVVDRQGRIAAPPRARVWIARARDAKPFQETVARLEPVGVPGESSRDVQALYVTHVRAPSAGAYYVLVRPIGPVRIGGLGQLVVKGRSTSPAVGSRAYPSHNPTLASAKGKLALLTTRIPPDQALLRYSIAGSLAAHVPFVVTFATPRYCSSRTCGPVVDVVDRVRRRFTGTGIRFIHVEIYEGNDPRKGENRWVREWHLPSEPWTFLVGRDGRIKAKFESSVSVRELDQAVNAFLR